MGLLDRFKKPEAPPPEPSKSKRQAQGPIVCSCGQTFKTTEKHHAHLHKEHPEHQH